MMFFKMLLPCVRLFWLNATQAKNDEVIYANEISKESKEMAERAEKIADGAKKGI